jgi:acetyl esterase/lipase
MSSRLSTTGSVTLERSTVIAAKAVLLVLLVLCAGESSLYADDEAVQCQQVNPAVTYPAGANSYRDVIYGAIRGYRPLTLDLYVPPSNGRVRPLVIFVHGGGWMHRTPREGGSFTDFPAVLADVAAHGYVVASVSYRFSYEAPFPAAVRDVGMAIQWLRGCAKEYLIDPDSAVLWGSSAGAQIASLIGAACDVEALQPPRDESRPAISTCVNGVIDWYGPIDFENLASDLGDTADKAESNVSSLVANYLGCNLDQCAPGVARAASPLAYIDGNEPAFLIQHGEADSSVSPRQSKRLYEALRAAGVPVELQYFPKVGHGFVNVPHGGPDDAVNAKVMEKIFEFLDHYAPSAANDQPDNAN